MFSSREIASRLTAAGFVKKRQQGSHQRWVHADGRKVTLPADKKDFPIGTLRAIERQAGISIVEGE